MKTFMTQSGFSLVQGMMLAGVVAGSSLVATRLLTDQKLAQRSAETRDQVEQLHKMIYSTLQDKDSCTKTFFNWTIPNTLGQVPGDLALKPSPTQIISKSGQVIANVGTAYMNNNVILKSMSLTYDPLGADPSRGTLELKYERMAQDTSGAKRLKNGYGAKDITKNVTIRIQRDPLYVVPGSSPAFYPKPYSSCYGVMGDSDGSQGEDGNTDLAQEMCEQLNRGDGTEVRADGTKRSFFEWDPTTSTCKPRENVCKVAGEVNTGINSNGEIECRRIQDWMDTSKLIDPSSFTPLDTGCSAGQSVKVEFVANKIKISCY